MRSQPHCTSLILYLLLCPLAFSLSAQQPAPPLAPTVQPAAPQALPNAPSTSQADLAAARISGSVTDTSGAAIPDARVTLEDAFIRPLKIMTITTTDTSGAFTVTPVEPGTYLLRIVAKGFSSWKVESILVAPGEHVELTPVELGVESINSVVDAITVEDLAEQQITAEEHQRILGILPNFFVSYVPNAAPLTKRQKFKLAFVVSRDPLTFITTGINAGIEQAEGDFAGYGPGITGYASRYGAAYGDRLSATFFGAAIFPSLFHQDPRYFYRGHGRILTRALYAISTVVICKGDNGHWQPNYSNVFGNLASGGISSLYYPNSAKHDVQTSVDNIFIGISEGAIGTLFQEFLLRHVTHGVPGKNP